MTDHESNLIDLYAGFAMMAMVMRKDKDKDMESIAFHAFEQAEAMIEDRTNRRNRQEGGIADILNKWGDES